MTPTFPAKTAPTVTIEDVNASIAGETFIVLPDGRTTICQLTLTNGFTVDGHSACVSLENYNKEEGEHWSRKQAIAKIWPLLAFRLSDHLATGLDAHPDNFAVLDLSLTQRFKLANCRIEGKSGWDSEECTQQHLSNLLHKAVAAGNVVDVANYCAFLYGRGETILPATE